MQTFHLLAYSFIYSDTAGISYFYFKYEETSFNTDTFKFFRYRVNLLGNTDVDRVSGILRNQLIFQRSLEMQLISCKVELKLKWKNHCVLSAAGADNEDANQYSIIFATKDTKLCVHAAML